MSSEDLLVIHDGQLIPKNQALALMLEEFTPFGYSAATIEILLARAFFATQNFLAQLNWVNPEQRKSALDAALKNDAEVAARWRAQPREEREAHAKRLEAGREAERKRREEAEERRKRYRQEQKEQEELKRKAQEELKRKARLQDQFERWEEYNERINQWNEHAEARAAERKREDDLMTCTLMAHIEEKEAREFWRRSMMDRTLDLIGDHEYIQWMFECFSLPSRRWLAVL